MTIIGYFDPDNIEHIRALQYREDNGKFPEGFPPPEIEMPPMASWYWRLHVKLAQKWIRHMLQLHNPVTPNMMPGPSGVIDGGVAQSGLEQASYQYQVGGSNPSTPTS